MRRRAAPAAAMGLLLLLGSGAAAQTVGPGGTLIAPGPSQPGFTPGGIGPGGTPVAPGPAARDIPMLTIGPGGTPVAPGPAGQIQNQQLPSVLAPPIGGSGTIAATIATRTKHGVVRHGRTTARRRPAPRRHRHARLPPRQM